MLFIMSFEVLCVCFSKETGIAKNRINNNNNEISPPNKKPSLSVCLFVGLLVCWFVCGSLLCSLLRRMLSSKKYIIKQVCSSIHG